jgi:aspartate aminotransferase/aminotransferase
MNPQWIAQRMGLFDSSGIRKVFELASQLDDPIDLSIGQPDFDVPEAIQEAAIQSIRDGKNSYALTQGMPVLREKLQHQVDQELGHDDRALFVTSGTSGALVLAMMTLVNPGEEVILTDPYFVMYDALVRVVGGQPVFVDTYPDFKIDVEAIEAAITPRTKAILFNSPANPTGAVASKDEVRDLAQLAARHDVALVSDEIYRQFCYDAPFVSPAEFNDQTLVIDGFSKTYAMTGWRVGFAHGPKALIDQMIKLQQYSFVCAPQPMQWAAAAALDVDMQPHIEAYHHKRDLLVAGLAGKFDLTAPGGAFYAFPRAPEGSTGTEFVHRAIEAGLLIIPGKIFSRQDTHFRISYAARDETIQRGVEVLNDLAKG